MIKTYNKSIGVPIVKIIDRNKKITNYSVILRCIKKIYINQAMVPGKKVVELTYDILRGVNATIWGGLEEAEKVGKIVKTGVSGADVVIGTSHALEDLACNDNVCCALDIIGSVSSTAGIVLGNMPATKRLTVITGSVTVGCRSVRYYCKNYGTFWGCTVAATHGVKKAITFSLNKVGS